MRLLDSKDCLLKLIPLAPDFLQTAPAVPRPPPKLVLKGHNRRRHATQRSLMEIMPFSFLTALKKSGVPFKVRVFSVHDWRNSRYSPYDLAKTALSRAVLP